MSFDLSKGQSPGTSDSQINGSKFITLFSSCACALNINMLTKIIDNRILTGSERPFMLSIFSSDGSSRKVEKICITSAWDLSQSRPRHRAVCYVSGWLPRDPFSRSSAGNLMHVPSLHWYSLPEGNVLLYPGH